MSLSHDWELEKAFVRLLRASNDLINTLALDGFLFGELNHLKKAVKEGESLWRSPEKAKAAQKAI